MLKTGYKDDIFAGARRYKLIDNGDGTVSLEDVTEYTQEGDQYGAGDINSTNQTVNELLDGTTPAGDASKLGGEAAEEWQGKIDAVQTTSSGSLSQAGWYRIAELLSTANAAIGANSCDVDIIIRSSSTANNFLYCINLRSVYNAQEFSAISKTNSHVLTKVRYVREGTTAYIEVYTPSSATIHFVLLHGAAGAYLWKAITPTPTAETVDGVTVTTTYDIPANATPLTSAEGTAVNSSKLGGKSASEYVSVEDYKGGSTVNAGVAENGSIDVVHVVYSDGTRRLLKWDKENERFMFSEYDTSSGWSSESIAYTTDLAKYLPLTGGTLNGLLDFYSVSGYGKGSVYKSHTATEDYGTILKDTLSDGSYARLCVSAADNGIFFYRKNENIAKELLHTGNSAPVAIQSSAPSDTSALWAW